MFNKISEKNINSITLPKESNLVNFSTFNELETDILFRSFSIKYVLEGCEKYAIDGSKYKINKGEFLLANNLTGGKLLIESNEPVKGLCIDISPKIMNEAAFIFHQPDLLEENYLKDSFFCSNLYPENKYQIQNNAIGTKLNQIASAIASNPNYDFEFTNEFYFELASCIVENQQSFSRISQINAQKIKTKKELFKKLLKGKSFIDSNFMNIKNVDEISNHCQMSEFQFFRLFKVLFAKSPYHHLNQKRLEYACTLIKKTNYSISEIALLVGYADLPSFSKSFKKYFGISPQVYKNQ